jgi:hypothetical protein
MQAPIKIILIVLLGLLMLFLGFQRESKLLCIKHGVPTFIERFSGQTKTDYHSEMNNASGFKISEKLQSVLLFSIIFSLITSTIAYLLSNSIQVFKIILISYLIYMLISFILIILGNKGVDYRLSVGMAHYLEDLFVSPYIILLISVAMKAFGLIDLKGKSASE